MNGRIYDPVLGRFLSADPNVDGVYDSQGYNRYSYVGNNPLNRTDPSGYFGLKDVGMIVAAVVVGFVTAGVGLCAYAAMTGATMVGGLAGAIGSVTLAAGWGGGWAIAAGAGFGFGSSFAASLLNGGSIGDAFKAGVIGGVVGGISAGIAGKIGDFAQGNEWFQGAGQNLAHGALQGGLTEATGGQFRHGFYAGFFSSAAGDSIQGAFADKFAAQTAAAAIVGGTASAIGGGKFANGAASGAFTYLFNHASHLVSIDDDPGYLVVNQSETEGKKVVGVYVTDDDHYNTNIATADRITTQTWGEKWSADISEMNKALASKGEAVEFAVVKGQGGYGNYLQNLGSRNSDLKVFYASFHGGGTESEGWVRIHNTAWSKKITDSRGVPGFEPYTQARMPRGLIPYLNYCSPADGIFRMNLGVRTIHDDLGL